MMARDSAFRIPKVIDAAWLARALGWQTQRARRWMKATGAGQKRAGRYVTTLANICAHFPEAMSAVLERDEDDGD